MFEKQPVYLRRILLFSVLYGLFAFFAPDITHYLYGYSVVKEDRYFVLSMYPLILIFTFLRRREISEYVFQKRNIFTSIFYLIISLMVLFFSRREVLFEMKLNPYVFSVLPDLIGYALLFVAIMGGAFVKKFRREMLLFCGFLVAYVFMQILVENYWKFFSDIILDSLEIYLPLVSSSYLINHASYNVQLEAFSVHIGPTCSGIYSMFTFSALFIITWVLTMRSMRVQVMNALLAWLLGVIVLFVLNTLRIGIIIVVGAYVSKYLAIEIFHEYLSAIFLLVLFVVYLYFVFPKITVSDKKLYAKFAFKK